MTPEITMENGIIRVPSGFGIGYEIDEEKLRKVLVRSETIRTGESAHPIPS
ncbi:hypothetical protein [Sporosarcina sp. OR05]|uniref:hypothetical protein n=1 Tax=Sporosarcina sp. OR05 TaxID=2969819 RepID=UPI00352A3838